MNALKQLLSHKKENLFSIFFTAGYPHLESTGPILAAAEKYKVDFVEVGMPYSDPLADGPVIQHSSTKAIANGMTIEKMFFQLKPLSQNLTVPILLMGYLNPVMRFGIENFLQQAHQCKVSGIILPDLPLREYVAEYKQLFQKYDLSFISLITPQTSEERIRLIDQHSDSFIYAVSSASTTGKQHTFGQVHQDYFERISKMNLKNPLIAGFGIHDSQTLQQAWSKVSGAICGSAFLKKLAQYPDPDSALEALMVDLGLK